jgi:hypothetical protein
MSLEEYEEKFRENGKMTGSGIGTFLHHPCPFCASADFMVCSAADNDEAWARGALCKSCGRGIRSIKNLGPVGWTTELFQTCGPDTPSWQRRIRRES